MADYSELCEPLIEEKKLVKKVTNSIQDKSPKFMGIQIAYGDGKEPKPLQDVGKIVETKLDKRGYCVVVQLDPAYLDWLERSRMPQNRLEGRPWWYPFTRIKKPLSRS